MIHELRTYTLHPGVLEDYLAAAATIGGPIRGNDYGVNHGYWTTESGRVNQVWHLWSFESFEERTRLQLALTQNAAWMNDYVPMIRHLLARQDLRLLDAVKPITPPDAPGGAYELQIFTTRVGAAKPWAALCMDVLSARERFSPNVGLWTGNVPQPNEVLQLWQYAGFDARSRVRQALQDSLEWRSFLAKAQGIVLSTEVILLLPTVFSPMR